MHYNPLSINTFLASAAISLTLSCSLSLYSSTALANNNESVTAVEGSPFLTESDQNVLRQLMNDIKGSPYKIDVLVEKAIIEHPNLTEEITSIKDFMSDEENENHRTSEREDPVSEDDKLDIDDSGESKDASYSLGQHAFIGGVAMLIGGGTAFLASGGGGSDGGGDDGGGGGDDDDSDQRHQTDPFPPILEFPEKDPNDNYSTDPKHYETEEYFGSVGKDMINASAAYARGLSGFGVTVAVVDSGFELTHPAFEGRITGPYNALQDDGEVNVDRHGTHVAGIVGGKRNNHEMHGVAWQSHLMPISMGRGGYIPGASGNFHIGNAWRYAAQNGADIVNNSWSFDKKLADEMTTKDWIEGGYSHLLDGAEALLEKDAAVVFSTGNDSHDHPSIIAAFPHFFPEYEGNWLAVTAVDEDGSLVSYANACGLAAKWCISSYRADYSAWPGGEYRRAGGTSMAAPYAAGSLALLKQAFPYLSTAEIMEILLDTAKDLGDPEIFGHGLIDLDEATKPIGTMSVPSGVSVDGAASRLEDTNFRVSPAFGDGVNIALNNQEIMTLDDYNRGYHLNLGNFVSNDNGMSRRDYIDAVDNFGFNDNQNVQTIDAGPFSLTSHGREQRSDPLVGESHYSRVSFQFSGDGYHFGMGLNPDLSRSFGLRDIGFGSAPFVERGAFDQPHLAMMETGYSSTFGFNLSEEAAFRIGVYTGNIEQDNRAELFSNTPSMTGAVGEFSVSPMDNASFSLSLGALSEEGSFLGSTTEGAFGDSMSSNTFFATLGSSVNLGPQTQLTLSGSIGHTNFTQDGLIHEGQDIVTTSFGIGANQRNLFANDDVLNLAISQPLRVESGKLSMRVPSSRNRDGTIGYSSLNINPQPSGREINLQANYGFKPTDDIRASLGVVHKINPGHSSRSQSETMGLMKFQLSF